MIKNILVGVDGSDHARTATRYAQWFAKRFDARVVGLHVVDIVSVEGPFFHDISGSLGFEPYLDFTSKVRDALAERGKVILEEFQASCAKEGVRSDVALQFGIVPSEICERAREADLVVIGHRGVNQRFSTGLLGGVAESVSRQCNEPVLLTPQEFADVRSPLLAYDGSERASLAMHFAGEVCSKLDLPLEVLTVERDRDLGEQTIAEARRYLEPYKLRLEARIVDGHAAERIPAEVKERGHDLVFMGSHGHGRILELVLGSTTEYVLRNVTCPVLLHR
jgi:nucleotide-binding universal stress UspA family protein